MSEQLYRIVFTQEEAAEHESSYLGGGKWLVPVGTPMSEQLYRIDESRIVEYKADDLSDMSIISHMVKRGLLVPVEPDYEAMKEVLAIPDESGAFFEWHSTGQLKDALDAALGDTNE